MTTTTSLLGISSMATRQLLAEVSRAWREREGTDVRFESIGGVDAAKRVKEGAAYDVVVLAADALEQLEVVKAVLADSVVALARSEVAIAVRHGAPRPRVDSERALKAALRSAARIGYSTGPSGKALQALFARWGIQDEISDRLVQAPPGVPVGALLARGEVELGFQQQSELMHLEGIDLIGSMPQGSEIITTFSGAVCAASSHPGLAREFLSFMRSGVCDGIKTSHGMQPT